MNFYLFTGLGAYASYEASNDPIEYIPPDPNPPAASDWGEVTLAEYMGDPPRKKELRKGDYHSSSNAHYFSQRARDLLGSYLEDKGVFLPVTIVDRPSEKFFRYWCTNVVDCLDFERSVIGGAKRPGSIGVVKRAVFDLLKWKGSDVFRIPDDPNLVVYCSERFVDACKQHKIKGMQFVRWLMDPDPIEIK
jgi:hypothetical protein